MYIKFVYIHFTYIESIDLLWAKFDKSIRKHSRPHVFKCVRFAFKCAYCYCLELMNSASTTWAVEKRLKLYVLGSYRYLLY